MGKLFGLLGHPVGHSMSPDMHNDAFLHAGLTHHYQAFDVSERDLQTAVEGIKALGVSGFNVTIPHKVSIMKYLDEIDEDAKRIGAVNTVVNESGKLIGYNTDGQGYFESLLELTGPSINEKRVLIIGAGGASRAIVTVLAGQGVKQLTICNRTLEKAQELVKLQQLPIRVMSIDDSQEQLGEFDVIINTTSVGMSPYVENIPISLENMRENTIVSDLIYNPLETKLLQVAKAKGAVIHNGVGMFVGQGAIAFEKWTNVKPDRARMTSIVEMKLGGKSC